MFGFFLRVHGTLRVLRSVYSMNCLQEIQQPTDVVGIRKAGHTTDRDWCRLGAPCLFANDIEFVLIGDYEACLAKDVLTLGVT